MICLKFYLYYANSLSSIQPTLRDRMEIIEINGYTIEEKNRKLKDIYFQNK